MSELPNGWETTAIDDIVAPITQRTPDEAEQFTYIDIASIDRETKAILEPQSLPGKDAPSRARKEVQTGDVLVSMTRPNLNAVALVSSEFNGAIASTGFDVLRPFEIDPRWLYAHTRSKAFIDAMSELVQGALYPAVKSADVRSFEIPLPPLNEQKRIADKLDRLLARVDAAKARLDKIPPLLKRLRQAILAAATSGRLTEEWREENRLPFDWQDVVLSDIATIQGGVTKDSKKQQSSDEEVPYLRVANVQRGFLNLDEIKTIRIPANRLDSLLLEPGDVLFNEGGDIDKLGRGWIWEGQIERCSFQNHVFRARLSDKKNQPKYISWWGNTQGYEYFLRQGKQTTNLASINKTMLSNLPIMLPPAEEQKEIVRRVEELFAIADRIDAQYRTARARVDRLTQSLLAKAFRGELVPQDPNDEPAAALLERIRAQRAAAPQAKRGRRKKEEADELPMVAEPKRAYRNRKRSA